MELLYVVVMPATAAAVLGFAAYLSRLKPAVIWGVAVGIGYVAGQLSLIGRGDWNSLWQWFTSPREAAEWLPFAVFVAVAITAVGFYASTAIWQRTMLALAALLCIALPLRVLLASAYWMNWSLGEKSLYIPLLALVLGLVWGLLATARPTEQPRLRPLLLVVTASVMAIVVALSGVLVYGELCGAVAAALAGTYLVVPEKRVEGAAGALAFSLGAIVLLSYFYSELPLVSVGLLLLALVMAGGRLPRQVEAWSPRWQMTVRTVLTLLPLVISVAKLLWPAEAGASADPYAI